MITPIFLIHLHPLRARGIFASGIVVSTDANRFIAGGAAGNDDGSDDDAKVYPRFRRSLRLLDKAELENMTENGVDQS